MDAQNPRRSKRLRTFKSEDEDDEDNRPASAGPSNNPPAIPQMPGPAHRPMMAPMGNIDPSLGPANAFGSDVGHFMPPGLGPDPAWMSPNRDPLMYPPFGGPQGNGFDHMGQHQYQGHRQGQPQYQAGQQHQGQQLYHGSHQQQGQQHMPMNHYSNPFSNNSMGMNPHNAFYPANDFRGNGPDLRIAQPYGMSPLQSTQGQGMGDSPTASTGLPALGGPVGLAAPTALSGMAAAAQPPKPVIKVGSVEHTYMKEKLSLDPSNQTDDHQQYQKQITAILGKDKESSYVPIDIPGEEPKRRGKKKAKEEKGEAPAMMKRRAPEMLEVAPLMTIEEKLKAIGKKKSLKAGMSGAERKAVAEHNNNVAKEARKFHKLKNNLSAKRGRQKRTNRTLQLMETKAHALAERNYWKARAFSLGADRDEWVNMPKEQRDDHVADFRIDPDDLLKGDGISADSGALFGDDDEGSLLEE